MSGFLQDLRFGIRALRKQAGLTAIAVLSLGAGIGITTTVFTWLNTFVFNPLPAVPGFERLVAVHTRSADGTPSDVSWADFRDLRSASTVALAGWDMMQLGLRRGDEPAERAWGVLASGNYFEDLQVTAALGRVLRQDDEDLRQPVVVLGHAYWLRTFNGDSGVVGRTITLNGTAFTVVGVAAPRFGGTYIGMNLHLYLPMTMLPLLVPEGTSLLEDRLQRSMYVVGRLKPGATVAQATAEIDPLALRAGAAAGLAQPLGAIVRRHSDTDAPKALRPLLGALLGVSGLALLIACSNVANLLLARAVARRREVAVRLAVGASRYRLVRLMLTESLVLAVMAGLLGVLLASWGRGALLGLLPPVPFPVAFDMMVIDGRVLAFAVAVTALTAFAFGMMPALQASRPDLVPALKDTIGGGMGGPRRLQSALVVAQVALSLVTLVSAGLFVRSLQGVRSIDTGMNGLDRVLLVSTDMRLTGITGDSIRVSMVRGLLDRVRTLPGVEAASVARAVPLGPTNMATASTRIEGYVPRPDEDMAVSYNVVGGDYLETAGIRLVEGRGISDADVNGNAAVAVVNEAFVRRFLAGRQAIGARVSVADGEWLSVVGVVATTKVNDYTETPPPVVFQAYSVRHASPAYHLHVRASGDPLALTSAVRGAFAGVSGDLPFLDPRNMGEVTQIPYYPQRVGAIMLAAIGGLALLLSAIGIYGVMAYTVTQRTREIGVRVALGAARRDVLSLVLKRAMTLTGLGLGIGLLAAFGAGRLLSSQLYGISGSDPLTFGGIVALLGGVAFLASWMPARRAARVDPMIALRSQ